MANKEIMIADERALKDRVYTVRGVQVMLDFELAEIYGYSTSRFNEQVTRNIDKFDSDFMFELTKEEFHNLKSQNAISSWGGRRKLPRAFTEQGVYMLMTVLNGDTAVEQSKALIRLFKRMKDYIIGNQQIMITQRDYMNLSQKVESNTDDIRNIKDMLDNAVKKEDLSEFIKLFDSDIGHDEVLILDGQPFKADVAYQNIYSSAKKSIIIIDNYIGVKTLQHLVNAKPRVNITIISDNKHNGLKKTEYHDFLTEYPNRSVDFIKAKNRAHDRYIVLDKGTDGMKVYLCGGSSKDAGKRITTISRFRDIDIIKRALNELLANPPLVLK